LGIKAKVEGVMKKTIVLLFIAIFIISSCFISAPKVVQASAENLVAGGWNTGTEVSIDLAANPAPFTWLQLLDQNGVTIDEPATLCHPIDPSKYGWVVNIYQLIGHEWAKLETTYAWMPDEEGSYNACAVAYTAGTYALFGYYDEPRDLTKKDIKECEFDFHGQYSDYGDIDNGSDYFSLLFGVPSTLFGLGDTAKYTITQVSPSGAITEGFSGTTTLETTFIGLGAYFEGPVVYTNEFGTLANFTVHLYFPRQNCSKDVTIVWDTGGECGEGGC
jgi:hypothetical protein